MHSFFQMIPTYFEQLVDQTKYDCYDKKLQLRSFMKTAISQTLSMSNNPLNFCAVKM